MLCGELRALGYAGSAGAVRSYLADRRADRLAAALASGQPDATAAAALTHRPTTEEPLPKARRLAWLLWRVDDDLADEGRAAVAMACCRSPALAGCRALALEFARLPRERDPGALRCGPGSPPRRRVRRVLHVA